MISHPTIDISVLTFIFLIVLFLNLSVVLIFAIISFAARSVFYTLNFLFAIGYFAVSQDGTLVPGTTLGLSILWLILWVPLSFICWYRPVYKALRLVRL